MWCAALVVVAGGIAAADDKPAVTRSHVVQKIRSGVYGVTIQVPDGGNVLLGQAPHAVAEEITVISAAGDYWVGLNCQPAGDALRSQLSLPKGVGLVVADVIAGSPAAKAGLKQYDVLVRFGKADLRNVSDLSKAVQAAKGKAVEVVILRRAKTKTLAVTPAKRGNKLGATIEVQGLRHLGLSQKVAVALQKAGQFKQGVYELRLVGPGIAVAPESAKSKSITIRIQKSDGKKAVIVVTRDGKTWKATEGALGKLPRDVRVKVEKALKGGKETGAGKFEFDFTIDGKKFGPRNRAVWIQRFGGGAPMWHPMPPMAGHMHAQGFRVFAGGPVPLEKKLDEINKKLDALQKAIEALKK
jgi:membrane-associated protease RseP (regulator of RpoE activity)